MRSLSASLAATAALAAVAAASSCYDGLYMIVARGTDEVPGPGSMGAVADLVASKIPHSKVIGVPYPATFNHYTESEYDGAKEVRLMAMSYASECPGKKMALLGYSQVRPWSFFVAEPSPCPVPYRCCCSRGCHTHRFCCCVVAADILVAVDKRAPKPPAMPSAEAARPRFPTSQPCRPRSRKTVG